MFIDKLFKLRIHKFYFSFGSAAGNSYGIAIREDETESYTQILYTFYSYDEIDTWTIVSNEDGSASLTYSEELPSLSDSAGEVLTLASSGTIKAMISYYSGGKFLSTEFLSISAEGTAALPAVPAGADEAKIMVLSDTFSPYLRTLTLQ